LNATKTMKAAGGGRGMLKHTLKERKNSKTAASALGRGGVTRDALQRLCATKEKKWGGKKKG